MPTYVGTLEADLQAASEYESGGIGPFFRETRREEPFGVVEFVERAGRALRKLGIVTVVTLFVDEQEVYRADEPEGDTLTAALRALGSAETYGEAVTFYIQLWHDDDSFAHLFSIEGSIDHPADEAALTVLDVATPAEADDEPDDDVEEGEEVEDAETAEGPGSGGDSGDVLNADTNIFDVSDDEAEGYEENMERLDLIEAFLTRVLAELNKELALADPEIDVWIDQEGVYVARETNTALPGIPGI